MKLGGVLLAIGCMAGWNAAVLAQLEPNDLNSVELQGTLEGMFGNQLKVKGANDQEYAIAVDASETVFRYRGTADLRFLSRGMLVRFQAEFDPQGRPRAAVEQLEIFTPKQDRLLTEEEILSQTPGIYPLATAREQAEVFKQDAPGQPPNARTRRENPRSQAVNPRAGQRGAGTPAAGQVFQIVGRLVNLQADKIQVAAGGRPLVVQLDPAVEISVSAGDATFCFPGDQIQVQGLSRDLRPEYIQAKSITVTGSKPLAPPERIVGKPEAKKEPSDSKAEKPAANGKR